MVRQDDGADLRIRQRHRPPGSLAGRKQDGELVGSPIVEGRYPAAQLALENGSDRVAQLALAPPVGKDLDPVENLRFL
ncbi:hypothetical protein [Xanthobacter pseudotagetidis]|uniref:hypothetical protein n=1 Tax=Xanthobacter pseudotagetidis TaxID=3119911 RepID=UPI00372AEF6F